MIRIRQRSLLVSGRRPIDQIHYQLPVVLSIQTLMVRAKLLIRMLLVLWESKTRKLWAQSVWTRMLMIQILLLLGVSGRMPIGQNHRLPLPYRTMKF
jgi:hypothetical protein